jgi:para-nitrobenzyl esterase
VLVWIYGGGFNVGSASMALYSGEHLAAKGVVQINIAYRLGTLGFLSHPQLTQEGQGASGNYGLLDQIAALQWIRRNVRAFGGDPDNVTLMGQSAGSMAIAMLQSSPMAKGLFHRVVGMSGSPFGDLLESVPLAESEADGLRFQKSVNASDIEALRDMGADRILAAPFTRRSPIAVDGRVLPRPPMESFRSGNHTSVPAMLGFTRDESLRSLGNVKTLATFESAVREAFPATADSLLKVYAVKTDHDVARALVDIQRDSTLGVQMANWARAQTAPTYVWYFTRRQPYAPGIGFSDHDPATVGAYHTGDVPYWLQTLQSLNLFRTTRNWEPVDSQLTETMSNLLIAFARSGVPSNKWPVFDAQHPRVMQLGEDEQVIDWPQYGSLDLLSAKAAIVPGTGSRARD